MLSGKPQRRIELKVIAKFTDGTEANVTPFSDFRTNNEAVAEVDSQGQVKSLRPGDTAIIVSYRGNVLPVRVLVPVEQPAGFQYPRARRSTTSTAKSSPS